VAAVISDSGWADICAAAKPFVPDNEARTALETVVSELRAFHYNRTTVAGAKQRAERMLKSLARFEADYRAQFSADDRRTLDLSWLGMLRRRPLALWLAAGAIMRANRGRKSVQHEWLYHRLCGVWLDHMGAADLQSGITSPPDGSAPHGPLIGFVQTAMQHAMASSKPPSANTVRGGIVRERRERENAQQLVFDFLKRFDVPKKISKHL
jgi:hypothetical protein